MKPQTKISNGRRRRSKLNRRNTLELLSMAIIPLALLICFSYIPMGGLQLAFKKFNYIDGIWGSPWNGLKNFEFLFSSGDLWRITKNTLVLNCMFILTTTVGGIIFGIILDEIHQRWAIRIYQTAMFLPYLLSASVIAYIAFSFLNTEYGIINVIIKALGGEPIMWYSDPKYWYAILIVINLWKGLGYSIILYYASVISIDASYYEAAAIDGANWLQSKIYITLPFLLPLIVTLFIMNISGIFYSDFGLFYMVPKNQGVLYPATDVIDTYVYRALMVDADYSKSAATGLYQSFVGFVLVMIANAVAKRYNENSAIF